MNLISTILTGFPLAICHPDLREGISTAPETHVHLNFLSFPLSQILEMLKDHVNENCFAGFPVPQTQISVEERQFLTSLKACWINLFFFFFGLYHCFLIYSINVYYTSMWFPWTPEIKTHRKGFPCRLSGKESTCQCWRQGFDPRSGKIPHPVEQLSPCATTIECVL